MVITSVGVVRHYEQTGKTGNPHTRPQSVGKLMGETMLQNDGITTQSCKNEKQSYMYLLLLQEREK
jgi:hypothetical protein